MVISLLIGVLTGGLLGGMTLKGILEAFNTGISNGVSISLFYALLGTSAVAILKSGFPLALANIAVKLVIHAKAKVLLK